MAPRASLSRGLCAVGSSGRAIASRGMQLLVEVTETLPAQAVGGPGATWVSREGLPPPCGANGYNMG